MRRLRPLLLLAFPLALSALYGPAWPARAQGVTGDEIVLGVTSAFKGNSASLGAELYRGYMACFAKVNSGGGVNGRKIRVVAEDDGYDPARAFCNSVFLVENDEVFLLFGNVGTPTTVKVLPLLTRYQDRGILLFAPFTGAEDFREHSSIVNLRASYRQETAQLVSLLNGMGIGRIGLFYQNDSYGKSGYDGVQRALAARGLKLAGEANYERGALFEKPMMEQVRLLRDGGAEAIICIGTYQPCAAFVRDARRSGFSGPIANISFVGSEAFLALLWEQERKDGRPYTRDLYNSEVVPFFGDSSIPLVARYRRDMERFAAPLPPALQDPSYTPLPLSFGSLEGYLDAVVLVEALKRAGRDLDRKRLMKAVEGMISLDVGLPAPISFGPGKLQGSDKVYLVKASGGSWVPIR